MGLARLYSRALYAMESPLVSVEVHAANGLPSFTLVGLPEASVRESRERVKSAIQNSGFEFPPKRITVNLAPADLAKSGGRFDLAIAIGVLVATEQLQVTDLETFEFFAELSLSGDCRQATGVLPSLLAASLAGRQAVVAQENSAEVQISQQLKSQSGAAPLLVANLRDVVSMLVTPNEQSAFQVPIQPVQYQPSELCLSDIKGQRQAKRALEVCASGGHSLMMVGEPGAGKTMLASRLPSILPELTAEKALETASIHSVAGQALDLAEFYRPPFYAPHHSASTPAIIGGGSVPKPGAISLAHNGVLFLDELPEFSRNVLEALREPLESRVVNVFRVNSQASFPANFQLVVALNPSPSGFFPDDEQGRCKDTPTQIARYLKKISGPLLDRIDCFIEVPAVKVTALQNSLEDAPSETSEQVRQRVIQARQRQLARQGKLNAELSAKQLQNKPLSDDCNRLLTTAVEELHLSARAYYRTLRLALTIADLEQSEISPQHLAEALSYRPSQRFLDLY